jgi:hypothetical protein
MYIFLLKNGSNFLLLTLDFVSTYKAIFLEVENHVSDRSGNLTSDNIFGRHNSTPLMRQSLGGNIATVNDFQLIKVLGKGRLAPGYIHTFIYMQLT